MRRISMTPIGPGGVEFQFVVILWSRAYVASLAPLSWGLGFSYSDEVVPTIMLQIGPIKIAYQRTVWQGDRAKP